MTGPSRRTPTHPGVFLREEVLPSLSVPKSEIAEALGISRTHLYEILNGKTPITADMAVKLGAFFRVSPDVWMNMQARYDLHHAQKRQHSAIQEIQNRESVKWQDRARAELALERAIGLQAPDRFLEAWLRGVGLVGLEFFETRRPGLGQKGVPLKSLDLVRDKWQACPNPKAVEAGIGTLSHGEAALLAAMCSFYNSEWGGELLRQVGVNGLADLAAKLDHDAICVVSGLLESYTGW